MGNKSWLVFYVSSHGFGHMTRCLAIMEELLEKTNVSIYVASGEYQNGFARTYLVRFKGRVIFRNLETDVGLVNIPNSLNVDADRLEKKLLDFVASWDRMVEEELRFLRNLNIDTVISDISPIGVLVGEKLGVRNIGVSNFTWVEQYEHLGISEEIIASFRSTYAKLDVFIEYDLMLPTNGLTVPKRRIDFISRRIDSERVAQIKKQYGKSIFITCGKSANLENIHIENFDGCIFTTCGIEISSNARVVQLPISVLDTQNYVAASDVVIAKAGWGTISEAVLGKTNLVLLEREGVLEDTHNINELKNRGVAISIKESGLRHLDMRMIERGVGEMIARENLEKYKNSVEMLCNYCF
ncbi:hypothetical protein GIY11_02185 [Aerococcaceae bacterium DSM 109653]|uniref:Glycosyl transferase family 28 C-terminal domain-containing protein n=1 Tax=Fundicoccus ignavus TaxID=2664442 RepID=A0A844BWM4_9LACT|nr:glycosyltransferase family protein [Fundicoccus ignavus]MRI80837.1 hypothetical protein [Fundicoccus ignavus]